MRNDADDDEREAYEMQHVSKKQRDVRVSYSLTCCSEAAHSCPLLLALHPSSLELRRSPDWRGRDRQRWSACIHLTYMHKCTSPALLHSVDAS